MRLFTYWARASAPARGGQVHACGASNTSLEEARANAKRIAERVAAALAREELPGEYEYFERPIREEIVRRVGGTAEHPAAVLTRNAYGSLVLNTERALFADLDYPRAELPGCLGGLFGKRTKNPDDAIIARVRGLTERDNRVGVRLYRTAAGFRCLVTHRTFDAASAETAALFERLDCDPLYARLCLTQECFRARLTPKPWRCELPHPPSRFPFETEGQERTYRRWVEEYELRSSSFSTCALVASFGNPAVHPDVVPILALHDELACNGEQPLA